MKFGSDYDFEFRRECGGEEGSRRVTSLLRLIMRSAQLQFLFPV